MARFTLKSVLVLVLAVATYSAGYRAGFIAGQPDYWEEVGGPGKIAPISGTCGIVVLEVPASKAELDDPFSD